jgi:hypothetical protein
MFNDGFVLSPAAGIFCGYCSHVWRVHARAVCEADSSCSSPSVNGTGRAGEGRSFSACCIDEVGVQDTVVILLHISFVFCILFGSLYS